MFIRQLAALAVVAACAVACTSNSSPPSSSSGPPVRSARTAATTATAAPALSDLGFDFVYDTVTSSFTNSKVWLVRNGKTRQVPGHGHTIGNPIPSSDGRSLLVARSIAGPGSPGQLAVIDLAGRLVRSIPHTQDCFPGGWGKGGIIVMSCGRGTDEDTWRVWTTHLDGSHRRAIAPDDAGDPPAVSADGTMVAYGRNAQTWVVPVVGGRSKMLLTASEGGAFSPDGKQLAVTCHGVGGGSELDLVNVDGSGHHKLTDIDTEGYATFDMFSPDGKRIVLAGSTDEPFNFWIVNVDGTGYRMLDPSIMGGDPQRLPSSPPA